MAVVIKHIIEPLPLPRQIVPDLPEEVERVILKALAVFISTVTTLTLSRLLTRQH